LGKKLSYRKCLAQNTTINGLKETMSSFKYHHLRGRFFGLWVGGLLSLKPASVQIQFAHWCSGTRQKPIFQWLLTCLHLRGAQRLFFWTLVIYFIKNIVR